MLTSLRIQNFRSIRDASVKLGQVNLFIGPNNSGKSNFLKGMQLLGCALEPGHNNVPYSDLAFGRMTYRSGQNATNLNPEICFNTVGYDELEERPNHFSVRLIHKNLKLNVEIKSPQDIKIKNSIIIIRHEPNTNIYPSVPESLAYCFKDAKVYQPDPGKFSLRSEISYETALAKDGANLIPFLFNLSQSFNENFEALTKDFYSCIGNLKRISTPPDPVSKGYINLKFFDVFGVDFWAEEVSEGVLYFLALLCIVHQPDPPKLLLLEEPEKGIHPRRIKEVMDFIFELAQLRGIQIILTSHSPYVVNHFADIPECISVFDREGGETVIRNAADIMAETNDALVAAGQPAIRYSDGLGEYWVSGFLGGIPL